MICREEVNKKWRLSTYLSPADTSLIFFNSDQTHAMHTLFLRFILYKSDLNTYNKFTNNLFSVTKHDDRRLRSNIYHTEMEIKLDIELLPIQTF